MYFSIIQLHEFGILDKLQRKYHRWFREDPCGPDSTAISQVLTLKDIWPLFILVAGGLGVSLVLLGLEFIASIFHQKPAENEPGVEGDPGPSMEIQPPPGPSGFPGDGVAA